MIPTIIAIIAIVAVIVQWVKSTQSKLVLFDENISNAMTQMGVQLSSRFEAMMVLLDLTKDYDKHEIETIAETIKLRRKEITAKSKPDDILHQEGLISEALGIISMVSERYLELKSNLDYIKAMDALQTFENMMRTSRLIYNDSVTKFNREIRIFPVSIISGMLGFRQRDYLEEQASKTDIQKNNNEYDKKFLGGIII